jgi:hypothetical protein
MRLPRSSLVTGLKSKHETSTLFQGKLFSTIVGFVLTKFFPTPSSGEFSLYDHVLDHSAAFNVIPSRYSVSSLSALDVYFAMGRGRQADGVDVPASEMKKWYVV